MSTDRPDPARELRSFLRVLATGATPGQFFDVRSRTTDGGMNQRFIPADRIEHTASLISRMGWRTDVYVGVALRDTRRGGKDAISGSHLVYIECDYPNAAERLKYFEHAPTMVLASGSPGHIQIYWGLHERVNGRQIESVNRSLALVLDGDPVSVDIARILRPPATMNHKHNPPLPVRLLRLDPNVRYELSELTATLPADPQPVCLPVRRADPRRAGRTAIDRALLEIPAADYVRVLTQREPNRAGKVLCPFHKEQTPSLQLYPDGTFYCYGRDKDRACGRGGTIFDFAAALWGISTKQDDFLDLRKRLADLFALTPTTIRRC